jgi:hypothetical protein
MTKLSWLQSITMAKDGNGWQERPNMHLLTIIDRKQAKNMANSENGANFGRK